MWERRYERTPIPEESGRDRAGGFVEILHPYTKEEAVLEAQRCLQCAMPYCVQACPITQDCRGYIQLIATQQFDAAARLTIQDNALATVLCKTCYHYCEEDCVMGGRGVPIAIRHLKRAALEFGKSDLLYVPSAPKRERIAVVGAGPAGITAAWSLALRGYSVTVFEKDPFVGGQVETIPKYHLDGDELDADLARFKDLDVMFVTGQRAGPDLTPESLLKEGYLAVFLAMGASDPRTLGIPGEALPGVYYALHFLYALNKSPDTLFGRKQRKVVVIGGGDVAMDAARSSLRISQMGDVTVAYRKTRSELSASDEELSEAGDEGVRFLFERAPVRIEGRARVESLVTVRTQPGPPDARGRPTSIPVPGTEEAIPCDTVIIAVGERADVSKMPADLDLRVSAQGWPEGVQQDWMTDVEGVFATGGKSVVYAMAAGDRAADAIDAYVARKQGRPAMPRPHPLGDPVPPKLPDGYGAPTWHF